MKKRILCILLALALLLTLPSEALAATYIKDPTAAAGKDYSAIFASQLDAIFRGEVSLFSNTDASFALGESLNINKEYQVAGVLRGYQCYIYAQAVYFYLFGDLPYHGDGYKYWTSSEKVVSNRATASYALFQSAGVAFGAYLRTTANSDGSYNSGSGHSIIILSYDTAGITYLEGNADGRGLVRVTKQTWTEFNNSLLTGKNRRICHIVQSEKGLCDHPSYDKTGLCKTCGREFDWQSTFDASCAGIYQVTSAFYPRTDKPYNAANKGTPQIKAGAQVEVQGCFTNALGSRWYRYTYQGTTAYAFEGCMKFQKLSPLEVQISDFSPADGAELEKKAYPVLGTIDSNYPLATIVAYLDGHEYARWEASNQLTTHVNLRYTDINLKLSFATLLEGTHTLHLEATSFAHKAPVAFFDSTFTILAPDKSPGKPILTAQTQDSAVTLTWPETANTTHYDLWLEVNNGGIWEEAGWIPWANSGIVWHLPEGQYRARLASCNANAWAEDGSDWLSTLSDDQYFTIGQVALATPQISKLENTAQGIRLTWDAVPGAAVYRVYIKTSTSWKCVGKTTGTSFLYEDAQPGESYCFNLRCFDAANKTATSSYNKTGWMFQNP